MTDNSTRYSDNISEKLAFYVALIRQENSNNMQSRNVRAEGFFAAFLNALKGWKLVNLNDERQNAPGLDLIDRKNKVIVQVSSTFTHDKIQDALRRSDDPAYEGYHFYFMAITDHYRGRGDFEPTVRIIFDRKTDIFDTGKLLKTVQGLDIAQQKALSGLVDQYFEKDLKASLRCLTEMPPLANTENVICRETELAEVRKLLAEGEDVLLMSGFGGIGKTALARLVFHTVKGEYDEVAWIPYNGSLVNSMMASFTVFNDVLDPAERWRLIAGLKNDGLKKLFVIDNADAAGAQDPQTDAYLQSLSGWPDTAVIVTSRLDGLEPYQKKEIGFLSPEACIELFYHYYENDQARTQLSAVEKLVELAQYHTLTVELFARGAKRKADLDGYYELLKKGFSSQKQKIRVAHNDKTATIEEHLRILFNIQRRTRKEKRVLQTFSLLPPAAGLTAGEAASWFKLDETILNQLANDGWLRWNEGYFSAHPLVQRIVRMDRLPKRLAKPFLNFVEDYRNGYFPEDEVYTERIRRLELAEAVLDDVCKGRDTAQVAHIFDNLGWACRQLAQYPEAVGFFERSLTIKAAKRGKGHSDTGMTYNNLGLVYRDMGDLPKALEYLEYNEKALTISEAKLEKKDPDTATTYNNLALVYHDMGDLPRALEYCEKALAIREKVLEKENPDLATTYNNLGRVYQDMGDLPKALKYYKKALAIRKKVLGKEHPHTATTFHNLGSLYYDMEQYSDAEYYLLQALWVRLDKLGPGHPRTKKSYSSLSANYQAQHSETDSFLPWLRGRLNAEENRALDEMLKK